MGSLQLNWGKGIGLSFNNYNEYFETLGYLTNRNHQVSIYTHDNDESGAWAGQGKLHNHGALTNLPGPLKKKFSLSGDDRLSVTDYVRNLVDYHNFTNFYDPTGNQYTY